MNLDVSPEQRSLAGLVSQIGAEFREMGTFDRRGGLLQGSGGGDPCLAKLASLDVLRIGIKGEVGAEGGWLERCVVAEELGKAGYRGSFFQAQMAAVIFGDLAALDPCSYVTEARDAALAGNARAAIAETGSPQTTEQAESVTHVASARDGKVRFWSIPGEGISTTPVNSLDGESVGVILIETKSLPKWCTSSPEAVAAVEWAGLGSRTARAAEMVGGARTAIDRSVEYTKERIVFGRPIAMFQAAQHLLARADLSVRAAVGAVHRAAMHLDAQTDVAERATAIAEHLAAEAYVTAVRSASQVNGGTGFSVEHWLPNYFTRAMALDSRTGGRERRLARLRDIVLATAARGNSLSSFWEWGLASNINGGESE